MIPAHGKIGKAMRVHFERLVSWCGHRNLHCEQFLAVGKRVWQCSALVSPPKIMNNDLAPTVDDIEPMQVPREYVEMRNEEEEVLLET